MPRLPNEIRITARVQALSGLAQLVTAVLVILLATWWFTHWRARRREQQAEPPDSDTPVDPPDETPVTTG